MRFHDLDELVSVLGAVVADGRSTASRSTTSTAWCSRAPSPTSSSAGAATTPDRRATTPAATSTTARSSTTDRARRDRLTTLDYLWRWDTDWFWCSRAFGAQNPTLRRFWPRRWLRSSVYWKLIALDRRFDVADRLEARQGNPPRERVVQDVEIPLAATADFLRWFLREVPIEPIWLCPLRLRSEQPWSLYPLHPGETYVNVGFWSSVPSDPAAGPGATNRRIEHEVGALGGHKSLYSESFYDESEFRRLYGGDDYAALEVAVGPRGPATRPLRQGGRGA